MHTQYSVRESSPVMDFRLAPYRPAIWNWKNIVRALEFITRWWKLHQHTISPTCFSPTLGSTKVRAVGVRTVRPVRNFSKFLVFGLFGVRTVRSCSVFELFAQSWLWSSIYSVHFRVKLLNGGVVNHYWPITPTYQILCITDPDLAHFLLNLRPIFKYQRLRLSLRAPSNQNQFETPTKSRSSKKSRVFKRAVRWWSKWIFTWIGLWWRKILADKSKTTQQATSFGNSWKL